MLCHLRRQYLQERMSVRNVRSALKRLGCSLVIVKLHVIDEAQVVVKPPVLGIILNAVLHEFDSALGLARAVWRLGRKKAAAEFVGDYEMRIQVSRDFEKRREKIVAGGEVVMPVPEVLHGASPVNAGHESVITETGALDHFRRTEEQDFIERGLRTQLIGTMQYKRTGSQRDDEADAGDDRSFLALLHFKVISDIYFKFVFQIPISNPCARRSEPLRLEPWWCRTRRRECSAG